MAEGSAGAPPTPPCRRGVGLPSAVARRCCVGLPSAVARRCCGCGLGWLVRRLRRQALCAAARSRPASSTTLRGFQYDPLSYARNFDGSGFGAAPDDDDSEAAQLYYSYTFSSRFVLAPSAAASAPSGLSSH